MSNTNRSRNAAKSFIAFFILGLVILGAVWVLLNRQFSLDVITNWSYEPSSAIATISDRTQLTKDGKFYFYATRPEVMERDQFNSACPRQEESSPILGCYTSGDRIFIYNITDQKLDGIKEVTAVHEMLHAAWQRMDPKEKDEIGQLLQADYAKYADKELKTRMEYYQRTEPEEFVNELHSILGTELETLDAKLEAYYAKYFDRRDVLTLYDNYSQYYTDLTNRADKLYAQMEKLSADIDAATKQYSRSVEAYSQDVDDFNNRANNGGFNSTAQFNSERAALVARSSQLEADRQAINASIATYNKYYAEYQSLGEELRLLNDSMDSYKNLEKAPSV